MRFPDTLLAFQTRFPDEAACWRFLRRWRWPRGFRCPRCKRDVAYWLADRRLEQCAACRYQASVTAGTVFHGTRVPLRVWFVAIFFVGRHKQGISALQLQRDSGIGSYRTAWLLLHKLRAALRRQPGELLSGLVEADETYLLAPHEKGRRGGRAFGRKVLVGCLAERGPQGRIQLDVLESHSFDDDLGPFIRGAIEGAQTTIRTDGLWSYKPLPRAGVRHERVVQGHGARGPKLLPSSHTVFYHLKSWLRGTFRGVSRKHLARYLQEFTFRFNHRSEERELALLVLRRALGQPPLPYARLTAEGSA